MNVEERRYVDNGVVLSMGGSFSDWLRSAVMLLQKLWERNVPDANVLIQLVCLVEHHKREVLAKGGFRFELHKFVLRNLAYDCS